MTDQVFQEALQHIPSSTTIHERNRPDLISQINEMESISAAWFLNEDATNHHDAIDQAINASRTNTQRQRNVIIPNFPDTKAPWLINAQISIERLTNMTVILEQGVTISAAPGCFTIPRVCWDARRNRYCSETSMFRLSACTDFLWHGQIPEDGDERPRIDMFPHSDHDTGDEGYTRWGFSQGPCGEIRDCGKRSGISLYDTCTNVRLQHFDIFRTAGDGIYAGSTKDCCVHDMKLSDNLRHNMSIISTSGITVTDSDFHRARSSWSSGIDIEPNVRNEIQNVIIRGCNFDNNLLVGISISFEKARNDRKHDVLVENCIIRPLHNKTKHGVIIGPIPVRGGNDPGPVKAECTLNDVEVRGGAEFGYLITRPESPQGIIKLNRCMHMEGEKLTPATVRKGFSRSAVIAVDGRNNDTDVLMDANSTIDVRDMEFLDYDGTRISDFHLRVRDRLQVANCNSGSITINGEPPRSLQDHSRGT